MAVAQCGEHLGSDEQIAATVLPILHSHNVATQLATPSKSSKTKSVLPRMLVAFACFTLTRLRNDPLTIDLVA